MDPNALEPQREVLSPSMIASFVDIRDNNIPGPGAHDANRIDKHTPSKWKFGKTT